MARFLKCNGVCALLIVLVTLRGSLASYVINVIVTPTKDKPLTFVASSVSGGTQTPVGSTSSKSVSVGKPSFSPITIAKKISEVDVILAKSLTTGSRLSKIEISYDISTGGNSNSGPRTVRKITLSNAFVTSSTTSLDKESPSTTFTLAFTAIQDDFFDVNPTNGNVASTPNSLTFDLKTLKVS